MMAEKVAANDSSKYFVAFQAKEFGISAFFSNFAAIFRTTKKI